MVNRGGTREGAIIAAVLAGAWRNTPPPLSVPPEAIAPVVPLLLETGAGALAWWRLRQAASRSVISRPLRDAYRQSAASAPFNEDEVRQVVTRARAAGAEPVLVKGWAIARLYAEPGLRPYGDIDVCVGPEKVGAVTAALAAGSPVPVDLHAGVPDLPDRTWEEVVTRSRLVRLADTDVRILGSEDQLRLLCFHFVRHGGFRPRWLCDIGVTLESLPGDFDWDYCLGGNPRVSDWVLCVLGLAGRLLAAKTGQTAGAKAASARPLGSRRPSCGAGERGGAGGHTDTICATRFRRLKSCATTGSTRFDPSFNSALARGRGCRCR